MQVTDSPICEAGFLHSLFPAFADVYFVKDLNKELIETDLTLWIDSHEVTGLAFVFKHLFISRSVRYVFTLPLVYNSTTRVLSYSTGEQFYSFPMQHFAHLLNCCVPSMIWIELENLCQIIQRLVNTRSKKAKNIQSSWVNISAVTWCYVVNILGKSPRQGSCVTSDITINDYMDVIVTKQ